MLFGALIVGVFFGTEVIELTRGLVIDWITDHFRCCNRSVD